MGIDRRNYEMKVTFLLIALVVPSFAKNFGSIPIAGAGNVYVVGPDWTGDFLRIEGNGFSLNGGGRIYFAIQPNDGFDPNMYWQTPLMDQHFSYMIDVSNVGCHCNSALFHQHACQSTRSRR